MRYALGAILVFGIAVVMAMVGRGGGNFYVPSLVLAGSSMHQAATTGQLILVCTALAALAIYGTKGVVDWKLALVIDPPTDVMALVGGYFAHWLPGGSLKLVLAGLLVLAGFLMLRPAPQARAGSQRRLGFWRRRFGGTLSLRTDPTRPKELFAHTTLLAAVFMVGNAAFSRP